jgi:hypothetical protein
VLAGNAAWIRVPEPRWKCRKDEMLRTQDKRRPMKTSLEAKEKNTDAGAGFLRRPYFEISGPQATNSPEKKNDLLTPFLLTIPVIIMLIILVYSL